MAHGVDEEDVNRFTIQIISMMVILPLASLKNLDSLAFASLLSLLAMLYLICAITWRGISHNLQTGSFRGCNAAGKCLPLVRGSETAVNTVAVTSLAFACHANVFTIQRELTNPTPERFRKVWSTALYIALAVYVTVGFCGYTAFGDRVKGNILLNYAKGDVIFVVARFLVLCSFVLSMPMASHPCIKNIELAGVPGPRHVKVTVSCLAALAVASVVSDVGVVFHFLGGPTSIAMGFILPCVFYLRLVEPNQQELFSVCVGYASPTVTPLRSPSTHTHTHTRTRTRTRLLPLLPPANTRARTTGSGAPLPLLLLYPPPAPRACLGPHGRHRACGVLESGEGRRTKVANYWCTVLHVSCFLVGLPGLLPLAASSCSSSRCCPACRCYYTARAPRASVSVSAVPRSRCCIGTMCVDRVWLHAVC